MLFSAWSILSSPLFPVFFTVFVFCAVLASQDETPRTSACLERDDQGGD